MTDLYNLPAGLPIPLDDGKASHLIGTHLPPVPLKSTSGGFIDLSELPGWQVIYCYPLTGRPGTELPEGWDLIPGARGCTPQACAFRDHYSEMRNLGVGLLGVSSQETEYQKEMVDRLHITFPVLSDSDFALADALNLPTIIVNGTKLLSRITLITHFGVIRHVNYPVFPPHYEPARVLEWLKQKL